MSGYLALTRKELRESLRTSRLLIAVVVFILSGTSGVLLTHYLPDLVSSQTSDGIKIIVPPQTIVDALDAYLKNVIQLPILATILLAMGAVAEERARGIGAMILSRPVSRAAYVLAKLTGHGLTVLTGLVVGAVVSYYYITLLFDGASVGPFVLINLAVAVTLLDVLAITLLCSTLMRSGVASGGLAFVIYILLMTLSGLWSPLSDSLPGSITGHAHALLAGTWGGTALLQGLAGGLVLASLCSGLSCMVLQRQEI